MSGKLVHAERALIRLHHDESGQDTMEYALLSSLMALAVIVGEQTVASSINTVFVRLGGKMNVPGT